MRNKLNGIKIFIEGQKENRLRDESLHDDKN